MKKSTILIAVVALLIFAAVGYALADTANFQGSGGGAQTAGPGSVIASVTVNSKITMQIDTPNNGQLVDLGFVDPGANASKNITVTVQSNRGYKFSALNTVGTITDPNMAFQITGGVPTAGVTTQPKPGNVFVDTYKVAPSYNMTPGAYSGTTQYTVTQQ